MNLNKPLYYCCECKAILPDLQSLFFVEEKSPKGFCSENCIEDFYGPLIAHFEKTERELRIKLKLENEDCNANIDDILANPTEVWKLSNELDEEIFSYIKRFDDFWGIVICKVYNNEASFVFLSTCTRSKELLAELRFGHLENTESNKATDSNLDDSEFSPEDFNFMQLLENKKSSLLADLLTKRKEKDIAFESFSDYEFCFSETLENPDEVFENKDRDGDTFFNYIKSYVLKNESYFYIISCLKRNENAESNEVNVFPVLAFPTNDLSLYADFRLGKRISAHINN